MGLFFPAQHSTWLQGPYTHTPITFGHRRPWWLPSTVAQTSRLPRTLFLEKPTRLLNSQKSSLWARFQLSRVAMALFRLNLTPLLTMLLTMSYAVEVMPPQEHRLCSGCAGRIVKCCQLAARGSSLAWESCSTTNRPPRGPRRTSKQLSISSTHTFSPKLSWLENVSH